MPPFFGSNRCPLAIVQRRSFIPSFSPIVWIGFRPISGCRTTSRKIRAVRMDLRIFRIRRLCNWSAGDGCGIICACRPVYSDQPTSFSIVKVGRDLLFALSRARSNRRENNQLCNTTAECLVCSTQRAYPRERDYDCGGLYILAIYRAANEGFVAPDRCSFNQACGRLALRCY